MISNQMSAVVKEFDYKWIDSFEVTAEDRLEVEIFIESLFKGVNAKFTVNNIHESLNNYFFFTGIDFEDLFSAHSLLQSSFNNVKALEKSLSNDGKGFEFELKEIKFNKNLSINISILLYFGNCLLVVNQSNNIVSISSLNSSK